MVDVEESALKTACDIARKRNQPALVTLLALGEGDFGELDDLNARPCIFLRVPVDAYAVLDDNMRSNAESDLNQLLHEVYRGDTSASNFDCVILVPARVPAAPGWREEAAAEIRALFKRTLQQSAVAEVVEDDRNIPF
jgi:hypothetical protein